MIIEKDIENYLKRKCPGLCLKFTSPGRVGVPDRILLHKGLVHFIEVKAPGRQPRPSQRVVFKEFEREGHKVHVVDSYESVDLLLKGLGLIDETA